MNGHVAALGSAITMAAVSTLGDLVWAVWIPQHRFAYGLTHGALLFLFVGLLLGATAGRPAAGAVAGISIGLAAAGAFYVLGPVVGYSAMFLVWCALWIALGVVHARLHTPPRPLRPALVRGAIAALGSGIAFYAISGIWRPFDPKGWDYAVHFAAWTIAYLPGFAALLLRGRSNAIQMRVAADEDRSV